MSQVILQVPGMSCAHCEKTVMSALQDQPGVHALQVNLPQKLVNLNYDESRISLDTVAAILDEEGYTVAGSRPA